jgi:hypothetical protein
MNHPMPRGDFRHRSADPGRPYRFGGPVPGAGRLVGGTAATASQRRVGHPSRTFGACAFVQRRLASRGTEALWNAWATGSARSPRGL